MNLISELEKLKTLALQRKDNREAKKSHELDMLLILLKIQRVSCYLNDIEREYLLELLKGIQDLNTVNLNKLMADIKDRYWSNSI